MTISDKQVNFIRRLLTEREVEPEQRNVTDEQIMSLDRREASNWIARLMALPMAEAGLPAGAPGSRHPFTDDELVEMNERSGALS